MLGIETSCDETAAALLVDGKIVADRTTRQVLHEVYGGVVPELASRAHEQLLAPAVKGVLDEAGLSPGDVSGVAVTYGPGLAGALLVGLSFAKGFAAAMGIPYWAVNHLEAHLWIAQLTTQKLPIPALALIVSGGHTLLIAVQGFGNYRLLGTTRDDAAGELFDKVGRVIGFPFPAGAKIDELALHYTGKPAPFPFTRTKSDPYAFSFSGIKTAALNYLRRKGAMNPSGVFPLGDDERSAICSGLMRAVARSLILPVTRALQEGSFQALLMVGGVSASKYLRREFGSLADETGIPLIVPPIFHCTDNGAMIAYTGYLMAAGGVAPASWDKEVDPSAKVHLERVITEGKLC